MEKPPVSVSLVNWNGGKDIIRCLESLYAQTYPNIREVVIVDNGSTDGSVEVIEEKFPKARILKNDSNRGFCKAHNQAIRVTEGEFVLLLNFDVLLEPDFLSHMVSVMTSEDRIGMVSGKLCRSVNGIKTEKLDSTGIIMHQYFPAPRGEGEEDFGQYDTDACRYILGPCGAAPLYRRAMLEDIKFQEEYFDEDFENYVEDVDLAWRAQLLGWKAVYEPSATASHERGVTRKTNQQEQDNYFLRGFRNRYLSMYKNITKEEWRKNRFKIINREFLFLFGPSHNRNTVSIRLKALKEALQAKNSLRNKKKYIQSRIKISLRELDSFFVYEQFDISQFIWSKLRNRARHFIHKYKVTQILLRTYRRLIRRFFPPMKVTLIYPGITECGFNSHKGNEGSWMNHGLAILSSALKNKGYDIDLIDLRCLTGWQHFSQVVENSTSEAAGITMMSVDYNAAVKAAEIMKKLKPDIKIFVGGPHPSICPEELEQLEYIDCVVKGEGEVTFPQLLDDFSKGKDIPRSVQGQRLENLDASPWSDRDLFNCLEEPFVPFLKSPFVTLIAGRGCIYNCAYCQPAERIMFGPKVRRRSVANVISEMKHLRNKYRFNSFMIHDDCFTEDPAWVADFCSQCKAEGFTQPFVAQSRADIICRNRDMIEMLRDTGLKLLIIGFESGSDRVLKFLRKGCTRQQNLEAARICNELGIKIWANYMLGLPTETNEEVLETLSMLEEIKPYHCSPAFYTPHPGSEMFEMGRQMGIHLITDHNSYRRNTYEPKIKGPDYEFLKDTLYKSIALAEDMTQPLPAAADSDIEVPIPITFRNKFKTMLMARTPRLYRSLKVIKAKCRL